MAWDTGLKEALVAYGPSNVPFELLPDGVKVGPLFFPYPTGGSYSGMSLSPYGGLSSPMISLLTVAQYTQGAMDYLNRIAGRPAPSPRLLDNVILGNMNDMNHPGGGGGVPIDPVGGRALFSGKVDLHPPDIPGDIGSEKLNDLQVTVPVGSQELGPRYWRKGITLQGTTVFGMNIPATTVPISIKVRQDQRVDVLLKDNIRLTITELTDVIIPPFRNNNIYASGGGFCDIEPSFWNSIPKLYPPPVIDLKTPNATQSVRG